MNEATIEIHKRLTLNWLIQGAAQHAGMTFHHLVADELNAINPALLRLYDQYALINLLQYWQPEVAMLFGSPARFWRQASSNRTHPFFGHELLAKYGGLLAAAGRERALDRCKEKGITRIPIVFSLQATHIINRLPRLEAPRRLRLVLLARQVASTVWGIPLQRLDGELVDHIRSAPSLRARSFKDAMFLAGLAGYGGVVRQQGTLMVVAKGKNWQLLAKELVKGTAELISFHWLNQLDDDTYEQVIDTADRIEFEPWMLQSGGELWRRLLASIPKDSSVAHVLMDLARLPAHDLNSTLATVIERHG
jgi:hypothetical protein